MSLFNTVRKLTTDLRTEFRKLRRDERGSVMTLVALSIVPLVAIVGVSVDVSRGYMVKSRLSAALDAAALAGGRAFYLPTRDDDINMFFRTNFPDGYMGATVTGPNITIDSANETITVTADAKIDTSFMRILGFNTLDVGSSAEIVRKKTALDVVLAMDMSGSMGSSASGGGTRIQAARVAAKELVSILFGNETESELLKIGLVPWNGKVNIMRNGQAFDETQTIANPVTNFTHPISGAAQSDVYQINNSPVPLLDQPAADWRGCVYTRYLDDVDTQNDGDLVFGTGTFNGTDWPAWEPITSDGEPVPGSADCVNNINGRECTPCLSHGITALQNQKAVIDSAIDDLQNPTGTTNIPGGLGWAWRVLMPEPPFTEGVHDPAIERTRAIVLLTDGENFGGVSDGYKTVFGYGSAGNSDMNDRLEDLSLKIKDDGVVIYTIQFANSGTTLQTLMKNVASGPNAPYYNYAPDADTLKTIFREVANHITELRLTK